MLIVCPSCASEYVIDADRVGPEGRSVRCAACRETWFLSPDDVAAALATEMLAAMSGPDAAQERAESQSALDAWEAALAEEGAGEAPAAAPEPVAPGPARPDTKAKVLPRAARWRGLAGLSPSVAAGLAVLACLPLALIARSTVVRAMPQSAGLYARLGLPVNLRGIELRDVVAFQTPGEGAKGQLVIEGDLVGVASAAAAVPPIEVEIRDGRDQPLYRWTVAPPRPALENRETARFRASLSAPPAQGRSVQVRFAQGRGTAASPKADASGVRP